MLNGLDILLLLKLSLEEDPRVPSKRLADDLFLEPSEITRSLKRCRASRLVGGAGSEKRVNRGALLEFMVHGFRYVFPSQRGSMTRGVATGAAAEPMKSKFIGTNEPPPVWPYAEGKVRGIALTPLHRQAPKAALHDPKLYELLVLADAIRGDTVRERQLAKEELTKRLECHV